MPEVPDKNADITHVGIAVRFATMEAFMREIQTTSVNAHQNSASVIQSMQSEMREMVKAVRDLTAETLVFKAHSDGLERAFTAIRALTSTVADIVSENQKWRESKQEEAQAWRAAHVADNHETAKTVTRISAMALTGTLLIGGIVGLVTYIYNTDKVNNQRDNDSQRDTAVRRYEVTDQRQDHIEQVLIQLCAERGRDCKAFR